MGKNIKRLSLALLALGLSAPAFADTCNPFNVTVPNQQGGFTIGADALYLQPSVPNGSYFTSVTNPVTPAGAPTVTNFNISNVDPNYHWGFDVTAGYRIPCTGNDITATWTHLSQNSDSDSLLNPNFRVVNDGVTTVFNQSATGSLEFKYDAVDLDVGQRVNFGDYFQFRTFAGVRWAQVEEDKSIDTALVETATGTTPVTPFIANTVHRTDDSKFNGFGPQVGFDGRYCLGYGFGVDANLTTSLLIGKDDNSFRDVNTNFASTGAFTTGAILNVDEDSKTRVVPAIDASLGLDYTYNFNNCDRSNLVVQAGWKVINYWNVVHNISDASANFAGTFTNNGSNVAFQGPYAGIKVNL